MHDPSTHEGHRARLDEIVDPPEAEGRSTRILDV